MTNLKNYLQTSFLVLFLSMTSVIGTINAQDLSGDANKGKDLFKKNCSACHALEKQIVGPALKGVVSRLKADEGLGTEWLQKWIKDNASLRASGDKYANAVYEKFGKSEMTPFPNLSEKDIDDILSYLENPMPMVDAPKVAQVVPQDNVSSKGDQTSSRMILACFIVFILGLVAVLLKLNQLASSMKKEVEEFATLETVKSWADFYTKYKIVFQATLAALIFVVSWGMWSVLMSVGVDKGYKPDQPIYFSHKIHAGINKINCQMCHSGAKYGKVSEIPSLNVCMNCHRGISEYTGEYLEEGKTREFYTAEIKKIYQHVGWDESAQAYTGEQKPIKWTRIHNMQDFVYFNHSQHVVAGEKAIMKSKNVDIVCKACHGQIDNMDVVEMANDFTMGWCIDCHRSTEVDMSNEYNKEYFKGLHDKLKKQYGEGTTITVDAIGGIECGKCHY